MTDQAGGFLDFLVGWSASPISVRWPEEGDRGGYSTGLQPEMQFQKDNDENV